MESFYDIGHVNDLRDIWDTDFDPSETLKLSSDADLHDWFSDREIKMSQVILHDKLISDALLGNAPIKTEHSYSLNSDGDSSIPDSPESLHAKMDGMDDDSCSMISSNIFNNTRINKYSNNTPSSSSSILLNQTGTAKESIPAILLRDTKESSSSSNNTKINNDNHNSESKHQHQHHHHRFQFKGNHDISSITNGGIEMEQSNDMDIESNESSSSDLDSNNDIHIKDEPMSPESSCPSSPSSNSFVMNLNMANTPTSSFTNTHIMFGHKKDELTTMKRTAAAANIQMQRRVIIPAKCNIKIEPQQNSTVFGLPPTPPSSLPSDESEGNQSPEHHLISPVSPASSISTIATATATSGTTIVCLTPPSSSSTTTITTPATTTKRTSSSFGSIHYSSSASATASSAATTTTSTRSGGGYSNGTSTRQPIHTPLISTQPKGSTGALILTDEEKRTLLAEGYPIPTRLPLTKAEEKSLKKIRRKIKNKISAQESRRKKKEYMDQLERKVEILVTENADYRKKLETLEVSNANLLDQLARLQALLNKQQQNFKK